MTQTQAHHLTWADGEQRGTWRGDGVQGQGGINWSRTLHPLLCIWERTQPIPGLQRLLHGHLSAVSEAQWQGVEEAGVSPKDGGRCSHPQVTWSIWTALCALSNAMV